MNTRKKRTLISLVLTAAVITLLLLSGPASAITVGLDKISSSTPNESSSNTFDVVVDLHTNDVVNASFMRINISATGDIDTCDFYLNTTNKTACSDFTINNCTIYATAASGSGYGYGYGYNVSAGSSTINISQTGGYGYVDGYGSSTYSSSLNTSGSVQNGEIICSVTWATPSVDSHTEYSVLASLITTGGQRFEAETATTFTVQNVPISGGGSGGGASTNGVSVESAATVSPGETVTEPATKSSLLTEFGLDWSAEDTNVVKSSSASSTGTIGFDGVSNLMAEATAEDAKSALSELLTSLEEGTAEELSVTKTVEVYTLTNKVTGEVVYKTKITLTVEVDGAMVVTLVESVPKDVAADSADMLGDFSTLQADPIVAWDFSTSGAKSVSYVVDGQFASVDSTTLAVGSMSSAETEGSSLWWLWLLIIIVIVVIVYFALKKS